MGAVLLVIDLEEQEPEKYISYNGLGRSPVLWGIPYMWFLFIGAGSMLGGMLCGAKFGPLGWLFAMLSIPVLLFIKMISETDDRAVNILLIEMKWVLIKFFSGSSHYFGGTLTIAPTTYGRRIKNVKRYFKKAVER
jgi:type IV secretion system protein VirB3